MDLNFLKKKIDLNLKNKKFYITDKEKKLSNTNIRKYINLKKNFIKNKRLKGNSIALIYNECGAKYWLNILSSIYIEDNITIFPKKKEPDLPDICKYYNNIIIFDSEKIKIIKNKNKLNNKILKTFNFISSSSGSTGKPKLILLDITSIIINSIYVNKILKFKINNSFLLTIPFIFFSSILHFFVCIISQVSLNVYEDNHLPSELINKLISKKINYFGGPPLYISWIIRFFKKTSYLKKIVSSGDFLYKKDIDKYLDNKSGYKLFYVYGITEAGGRVCINEIKKNQSKYSVGKILPYMKFKKNYSKITIKSNYLFKAYYTNKKFIKKYLKIFNTGDLGKIDKKNNLYLFGRNDDIFKSSGEKVFPQKIKDELIKFRFFDDIYVFRGHIDGYGNVPFCAYVSKKKIDTSKLDFKFLSSEQIPKKFFWFNKFPRLGNNKINRQKIIKMINEKY